MRDSRPRPTRSEFAAAAEAAEVSRGRPESSPAQEEPPRTRSGSSRPWGRGRSRRRPTAEIEQIADAAVAEAEEESASPPRSRGRGRPGRRGAAEAAAADAIEETSKRSPPMRPQEVAAADATRRSPRPSARTKPPSTSRGVKRVEEIPKTVEGRAPRRTDRLAPIALTTRRDLRRVVAIPYAPPRHPRNRRSDSSDDAPDCRDRACRGSVLAWPRVAPGCHRNGTGVRLDGSLRQVHGPRAKGSDSRSGRGAALQPQLHRHGASAPRPGPRG